MATNLTIIVESTEYLLSFEHLNITFGRHFNEFAHCWWHAGAKYIFTVPELLTKAEAAGLPVVLIEDSTPANTTTKPVLLRYSDLLSADAKLPPRAPLSQSDPAVILFSSGTTGESKGVVLTHGNLIAMCAVVSSPQMNSDLNRVILHLIPMFHIFGLMISVGSIARGITIVVLPRFDFLEMLGAIQTYKVTGFPLVPPILLLLIKQDVVEKYDMTSLRNIGCGAAPLGKEQLDQCARRFPNAKLVQVPPPWLFAGPLQEILAGDSVLSGSSSHF